MSKTFNSIISSLKLTVYRTKDGNLGLKIGRCSIHLDPSDAPALALSVTEAAGYREERKKGWDVLNSADENIAQAMRYLSKGIEIQERATAEAKERAELEAEALELMNVRLDAAGNPKHLTKETVDPIALEAWIAVARRAREMRNEKKEPTND